MYTIYLDNVFVAMFRPSRYYSDFYVSLVKEFGVNDGSGVGVSYRFDRI